MEWLESILKRVFGGADHQVAIHSILRFLNIVFCLNTIPYFIVYVDISFVILLNFIAILIQPDLIALCIVFLIRIRQFFYDSPSFVY